MCCCVCKKYACVSVYVCMCAYYICVHVSVSVCAGVSADVWECVCVSVHVYKCGMPNIKFVFLAYTYMDVTKSANVKVVLHLCPCVSICLCVSELCVLCAKYKISIFGMNVS